MSERITVISHCQTPSIVGAFQFMLPCSDVVGFRLWELQKGENLEEIYERVSRSDFVVALEQAANLLPENLRRHVHLFPSVEFNGFQPDVISLRSGKRMVKGPTAEYLSLIAFSAWQAGFSPEQAVGLYNRNTYRALGYIDGFQDHLAKMIADSARCGLEIGGLSIKWLKRGCFTYAPNHPKSFVIVDIVRLLCQKCGIRTLPAGEFGDFFPDDLRLYAVCPMYPEIAADLRIEGGSYIFKGPSGAEVPRAMELPEFVERSFAAFASYEEPFEMPERVVNCMKVLQQRADVRLTA